MTRLRPGHRRLPEEGWPPQVAAERGQWRGCGKSRASIGTGYSIIEML